DGPAHVGAAGRAARLAGGDDLGGDQVVAVLLHERGQVEQAPLPLGRGGGPPGGRRRDGRPDRVCHVLPAGARGSAVRPLGGGIDEVGPRPGERVAGLARDDVADLVHLFRGHVTGSSREASSSRERSEEHTSELQSRENLVCRLLLEKKKIKLKSAMKCNAAHEYNT